MLYKNSPAKYAIETSITDHYFSDERELEDFAKGMLVGGHTTFSLYHFENGEWVEQDWCPYDFYADIDDTPYPVAHGQFLAALEVDKVDSKIIWRLGQGEREALNAIDDDANSFAAHNIFKRLEEVGAWDELNDELQEEEETFYTSFDELDEAWAIELDI